MVKIEQKYRAFYTKTWLGFTVAGYIISHKISLCVSLNSYVAESNNAAQQYKKNTLLHFDCKNGYVNTPQC